MIEKSCIYDIMTISIKQKGDSTMFCKHCGATIEEGDLQCASCGMPTGEVTQPAQAQEVVAPVEEPIYQETVCQDPDYQASPQQSEPTISLNTEVKVSKPKKGKIIAIVIVAILLVGAILVALNFSAIKVWFSRTFASPEEIMTAVYKDGVTEMLHSFSGTYEKISDMTASKDQTVESEVRVKLGDHLIGLLNQLFSEELKAGENNASWLSNIGIVAKETQNGELSQHNLALCLGDTTIISLDSVFDGTANKQWISVPEINDQSIYYDSFVNVMSLSDYGAISTNTLATPSFDLLESVYSQFADFMLEYMGTVESETKPFTVGQITDDIYVLETKFTEETLIQLWIRMFEALKQNAEVKAYFDEYTAQYKKDMEALCAEIGLDPSHIQEVDMYAEFVDRMDEAIIGLQDDISNATEERYLVLYTYLDSKNAFAGLEVEVFGADTEWNKIRFLKLNNGENFAQEIVLGNVCITGSGTEGDLINAVYSVAEEEEIIRVEIKDAKSVDDRLSGTFRIIPGDMLMDEIGVNMNPAAGAMLEFADLVLEIQLDYGKTDMISKISLLLGSSTFITIESNSEKKPAEAITVPVAGVNAEDDAQMEAWVNSIDVQKILSNLVDAGFPQELMTLIYQELMSSIM